ncbi:MAG: protease modulator HflC [Gammaproteobacteria bacterium]|nr:protease modulator HflC [Gammaproteobacteria bacterium]
MAKLTTVGSIALILALLVGAFSTFSVNEWERAILFRLGEIRSVDFKPGLHFKWPFVNNIRKFDARVLTLDVNPERFLTQEKKNVIVDSFVKWKIDNLARYYTAVLGDEAHARLRLEQIIKDGMRSEFGKRTIREVVSGERAELRDILTKSANEQSKEIGITVVDVRIKRVDLPEEVSNSVFRRMDAERARVAKDFRSRGFEAAEKIRADADRQREVLQAEAYRDAERIRGEGDGRAAAIYAESYGKDPEFYAFYRSLGAYRRAFNSPDNLLVLEPDAEFFQYFKDSNGRR